MPPVVVGSLWMAVLAATLAVAATPLVRRLARATGVVAFPKEDRWHTRPIPMLGGLAIFVAAALSVIALGHADRGALPLLVAGGAMFSLGIVDDFLKLKPSTKLTGQIAVACVVVVIGPVPSWTAWHATNALLCILWIVTITNAFNLLDNMDGLCAGVAAIAGIACWIGLLGAAPVQAGYAAAIAGASLGFLVFNFKPASIFMGDGGSLFLGGSLAVLALQGQAAAERSVLSAIAVPVFLLLIPLFDTTFVTLSRILSTRSAARGGRDHTSHRLVAMGFSEREAVLILYALAGAGGAAALLGGHSDMYDALLIGPLLLIALTLLGIQLARVRVYDGDDFSLLLGKPYTPLLVNVAFKRRVFEVILDLVLVTCSYYAAYVVRFDREFPLYYQLFARSLPIIIACQLCSFFVVGVYRGTWRHISLGDLSTYAKGIVLGVLTSIMALVYLYRFEDYSRGVFAIDTMMLALLVLGSRLSFRVLGDAAGRHRRTGHRVLIYGAGDGGALLLRELRSNATYQYQPVAFLDDDTSKMQKRMLGLPIVGGVDGLEAVIAEHRPEAIIVSTTKLDEERLRRLQAVCYDSGTSLLQLRFSLDELPRLTAGVPD